MGEQASGADCVSVVFAANDYYLPYLATLVVSVAVNYQDERPLELIVLERDFTAQHRWELARLAEGHGATMRFLDVGEAMAPYADKLRTWAHFKVETYFRLLMPQLLPDHHKVVYLDADMVCLANVAELFDTDVSGCLVAACKDPDTTGIYNGVDVELGQPDKRAYMDEVLKIENPYDYFQAGTIVFNLDEWRERLDIEEVFAFAQRDCWQLLDQDVLNYFCQGHVRFVDMSWNVMFDNGGFRITDIISRTTPELYAAYMEAREDPRIIHYAGPFKPWIYPECDFAAEFWNYARLTPYANLMVMRVMREQHEEHEELSRRIDELADYLEGVDIELQRHENRSALLMLKEFCYQKVMCPLSLRLFRSKAAQERVERIYRTIHPKRDAS